MSTPKANTSCHCAAEVRAVPKVSRMPSRNAAEHGAGDVADPAEHGRGERLEPGDEAHEEVDLAQYMPGQRPRRPRPGPRR